ncbi:MAG: class I mannose-6-phosphate isomerase [Bacteroidales bacterium]|nr:class I mannose-6-phosphate isomerase [Bacteroidales bacterium]
MSSSSNGHLPFLLHPAAKDYLWGGSRLNDDFGKAIPLSPLAETWECSTHPDGQSVVASGPHAGRALGEVLAEHPEYLGTHSLRLTGGRPELPVLVKLIDARRSLSVQVHPDDDYAREHEGGSLGKTEFWYVLGARKGAQLVYGFNRDVTPDQVRALLAEGRIGDYLNHVPVARDDIFFVRAGTVHAIGAGVLLVEIQESSNLTYRLYDYGRTDSDGHPRELHIDKALDVADLRGSAAPRQPMRVLRYAAGTAGELLARCRYFQVERLLLNTELQRELSPFRTGPNSFHTLLCTEGCGVLFCEDFMLNFFKGDCVFIPADSPTLRLHGRAQILNISC